MRIPQELKDLLDAASEENRRSMTAEVVARLHQTFSARGGAEAVQGDVSGMHSDSRVGEETLETVKRIEEQVQALAKAMGVSREAHVSSATDKSLDKPASRSVRSTEPKK